MMPWFKWNTGHVAFHSCAIYELFLVCILGSHLYMKRNHAKLFIAHRIDFLLTWSTICPVKCKVVKPCNKVMHTLTFCDLCVELYIPDLLTRKYWSFAFTMELGACPDVFALIGTESASTPCETLHCRVRRGAMLWTFHPLLPLWIFPINISWDAEKFPAFRIF